MCYNRRVQTMPEFFVWIKAVAELKQWENVQMQ